MQKAVNEGIESSSNGIYETNDIILYFSGKGLYLWWGKALYKVWGSQHETKILYLFHLQANVVLLHFKRKSRQTLVFMYVPRRFQFFFSLSIIFFLLFSSETFLSMSSHGLIWFHLFYLYHIIYPTITHERLMSYFRVYKKQNLFSKRMSSWNKYLEIQNNSNQLLNNTNEVEFYFYHIAN